LHGRVTSVADADIADPAMKPRVSLAEIALVHARIGMVAFGGGMSGLFYREVVINKGWMTEEEFLSGLAICQIIPGVNIGNLTVYIGQQLRGALGALVALAALLTGPFFFVIGVGMIYDRLRDYDAVIAALAGVTAAAMGMLMLVVVKGSLRASRTDGGLLIITSVAMAIGVLRWPMIPVLLVAAPVSIGLAWRRGLRNV
jgi:chromate transporter